MTGRPFGTSKEVPYEEVPVRQYVSKSFWMSDGFCVFVSASIMRMRALVGIRCFTSITGGSVD